MVRLNSVTFIESEGTPQEWYLDNLELDKINLLVGKNASGKSRALNIISGIAKLMSGTAKISFAPGNYDLKFSWDGKEIRYQVKFVDEKVVEESFSLDNKVLLNRGIGGEGNIWAEDIEGGKEIRFQTPISELAIVARQDSIQHKFLEPLFLWASSMRHYPFGSPLGKDHFAVLNPTKDRNEQLDGKDTNLVVLLYKQAEEKFGLKFKKAVMKDLQSTGYKVEDMGVGAPVSIRLSNSLGSPVGLFVKEKDLPGITDQTGMSQGMFRALSLLIQINYSQFEKVSTCILIDDIGEGLDFDRSCQLIDLIREKAKKSDTQLIMSTNDRFVMNRVPLEEWSVLQRTGNHVKVLNINNSKELFEEFKFTGLSNFTFLEMGFGSEYPTEDK